MLDQLMNCCLHHKLLSDFQSAYWKKYSTETSLLNITNDILYGMENLETTIMLIFNLSVAFHTVEKALKWFNNYLRPRYFKVCTDGKYSESKNLTFSVPQGSCSNANLLSCYCSLITTAIPNSLDLNRFADYHSIRAKYKVSNTTKAQETKKKTGKHI